ncbi:hypothetical protein D3C71_1808040 [compost metagenome]
MLVLARLSDGTTFPVLPVVAAVVAVADLYVVVGVGHHGVQVKEIAPALNAYDGWSGEIVRDDPLALYTASPVPVVSDLLIAR